MGLSVRGTKGLDRGELQVDKEEWKGGWKSTWRIQARSGMLRVNRETKEERTLFTSGKGKHHEEIPVGG